MTTQFLKAGAAGFAILGLAACGGTPQTADLGQVLDRTEFTLTEYENYLSSAAAEGTSPTEATDEQMAEFAGFLTDVMNSQPTFYDQPIGMEIKEDAVFQGFVDKNMNRVQDSGEKNIFTVEIDSENMRLIATDETGEASHKGFSGSGLLAGLVIGRLLSRQSAAGIRPGSFNNRTTTARSAYQAKPSARSRVRSGGSRAGK